MTLSTRALGFSSLFSVIILWVISSFIINELFENDLYSKPFFITYINTSVFIFYLVPYFLKYLYRKYYTRNSHVSFTKILEDDIFESYLEATKIESKNTNNIDECLIQNNDIRNNHDINRRKSQVVIDLESQVETTELISTNDSCSDHSSIHIGLLPSHNIRTDEENNGPLSLRQTINLSFQFCILWYLANLGTNASLKYTSVSSQTILSTTSSFFTLFLGYFFKIDKISRLKIISLVLSMIGIIIITRIDAINSLKLHNIDEGSFSATNLQMFFGNILALLGALFYGFYTVLLKLKVKSEERLNTKIFFGFVGIFNLILLWPSLILWNYLKIEIFELPSQTLSDAGSLIWKLLLVNCLITFISDYCWAIAVLLTSPLLVTVGLSFTIPLALIGDCLYKGKTVSWEYLLGAGIICISFLLINRDESNEIASHNAEEHEHLI